MTTDGRDGRGRGRAARYRLGVLLRGLRWRLDASVALLLVAVAASAAAAAGPLYLQAAGASTLRSALLGLPVTQTGLTLAPPSSAAVPIADFQAGVAAVPRGAGGAPLFGPPIVTETAALRIPGFTATAVARTGICQHLVFTAGTCPTAPGVVAMTARSAAALHVHLGSTLQLPVVLVGTFTTRATVRVGGIFAVPDSAAPYWWQQNFFQFGSGSAAKNSAPPLDDVVAGAASFGPDAPFRQPFTIAQLPMDLAGVEATGIGAASAAVDSYVSLMRTPRYGLVAASGLAGDLSAVGGEQHLMTTVVAVVDLEVVLLALCVLYSTVSRTAEERRAETRLARLRGFSLPSVLSVAATEPAVVVVVAFPVGLLIAWLLVAAAGQALFAAGTPIGLPPVAVGAAAAACLGGVVAIAASGWQLARADMIGEAPAATSRRRVRRDALEWAAVVLAAAALIELSSTGVIQAGHTDPVAAAAPALVALGLAVIGLRLLPLAAGGTLRLVRDTPHLASFLAARRVSRRPPLLRQIVLLSVAFGILCFASAGWVVARQNRSAYSNFSLGAAEVATVSVPAGADFVADVRAADPSGRQAMAVARYNGTAGTLLAVDSSRLAAVSSWPAGLAAQPVAAVAALLHPPAPAALVLRGTRLRAVVTLLGNPPPISLEAAIFDDTYQATNLLDIGTLQPGTHTYTVPLAGACATTCRLVSLSPSWTPASAASVEPATVRLRVDSLANLLDGRYVPLAAHLGDPADWRPVPQGTSIPTSGITIGAAGSSLALAFGPQEYTAAGDDTEPAVELADVPASIPVVMTSSLAGLEQGAVDAPEPIEGLDGNTLTVTDRLDVSQLPAVGDDASLMDLTFALDSISGQALDVQYQVWMTAGASPAILRRLAARGYRILGTSSAADLTSSLDKGGMALGYDLFLFAALAAVVLAGGSTLFAIRVSARRTAAELAALLAVGVPRATLRRAVVLENGAIALAGVALGVAGGVVAVRIALPSLPEFALTAGVPPLQFAPPGGPLAIVAAGGAVVVALTVLLATAVTMRGVRPELLRQETA